MWEWFIANGIWILLAVVVGFVLFFLFPAGQLAREVPDSAPPPPAGG